MNIKKSSILTIISVLSYTIAFVDCAHADSCHGRGWYVYNTSDDWCMPCPVGCYCPEDAETQKSSNQQWLTCGPDLEKYGIIECGKGWTTEDKRYRDDGRPCMLNAAGDHTYCQGAQTRTQCFFKAKDTGKAIYKNEVSITCPAGQYINTGYENCQPCPSGKLCPGGVFEENGNIITGDKTWSEKWKLNSKTLYRSPVTYSGMYSCPSGKVPNSNHTACEKKSTKVTCKAGQYLQAGMSYCTPCRDRYYCLGGTFTTASIDQGLKSCLNNSKPNAAKTACVITCKAGQYLPGKAASCKSCKDRYYCPGGTYFTSPNVFAHTSDQGLLSCPSNKVPNKDKTACEFQKNVHDAKPVDSQPVDSQPVEKVSETFNCSAGQYLPAKAKNCQQCKSGYYCAGGDYAYADIDQGAAQCPVGFHPNDKQTECEKDLPNEVTCSAGFYLPAKTMECKKCTNSKRYCPGGKTFKKDDIDQGIYNCPSTSVANDDKSACVLKLSKSFMQYGPNEKASLSEQCWSNTDSAKYKLCLFGNNVVLPEVVIDTDAE